MGTQCYFLHGLDSSGQGTKGKWFGEHFPQMGRPDFVGTLAERLAQLEELCSDATGLTFVGSSFGGLMATIYAARHPERCSRIILLAPALNFEEYTTPPQKITTPTLLVIGKHDDVTPPDLVLPLAEQSFAQLEVRVEDDDHMLHSVFYQLDWKKLLAEAFTSG